MDAEGIHMYKYKNMNTLSDLFRLNCSLIEYCWGITDKLNSRKSMLVCNRVIWVHDWTREAMSILLTFSFHKTPCAESVCRPTTYSNDHARLQQGTYRTTCFQYSSLRLENNCVSWYVDKRISFWGCALTKKPYY